MGKFTEQEKKEWSMNKTKDSFDDYIKNRNLRLAMKPEERAEKSKGWFGFVYFGFFQENPTDEIWQQAKQTAIEFYTNNPYRIWCDVQEWKYILTPDSCMPSVLNVIVPVMSKDIKDSIKNKEYQESRQKNLLGEYTEVDKNEFGVF